MEVGLRLKDKGGDEYPILEGYLYVSRNDLPVGKARWFELPLFGDEPLKQRVGAALFAIINRTRKLEINPNNY